MTEHWFYHLESATLQSVLPNLLEKTRERGWTAMVKVAESDIAELDTFLWTYRDDSFLPHGRDDEPQAAQHPIRLSFDAKNAGGADVVFITDGTEVEDVSGVSRCIFMINGRSSEAVQAARGRWARLKKTDATMSYWQQDARGQWEKKA